MIYHEIDFLLPTQRFNINFSFVSKTRLPFIREFILRLVHLAPLSMSQIQSFFDFSFNEAEEAIEDLVLRGELVLKENNTYTLTHKANMYFKKVGEPPLLSSLQDSNVNLSFDLVTFSCVASNNYKEKWQPGFQLSIDREKKSRSEKLVEQEFQRQFYEILHKNFLPEHLQQKNEDLPSIYTINSVKKLVDIPLRLSVPFEIDENGKSIERDDFEVLRSSSCIQEQISKHLRNSSRRSNNLVNIEKAMNELEDYETLKIFNTKEKSININFFEDLKKIEFNTNNERTTFIGTIYQEENWDLLKTYLEPVIKKRANSKLRNKDTSFSWLAPSDPYWGKSIKFHNKVNDFLNFSKAEQKTIYIPIVYLPVPNAKDTKAINDWKHQLPRRGRDSFCGIIEGFLGGNVEVLLFEGEFVVVIYHLSLPDAYPVSFPLGFISDNKQTVSIVADLLKNYLSGMSGFEQYNDCGPIFKS